MRYYDPEIERLLFAAKPRGKGYIRAALLGAVIGVLLALAI